MTDRAGIIPYYFDGDEVIMLFFVPSDPRYGGESPQIAKGQIDPGEDPKTAAIREGYEEVGLVASNILNIEELPTVVYNNSKMTVFIAEVRNIENFVEPGFECKETMWLSVEEFMTVGRRWQQGIVAAAYKQILKNNFG